MLFFDHAQFLKYFQGNEPDIFLLFFVSKKRMLFQQYL